MLDGEKIGDTKHVTYDASVDVYYIMNHVSIDVRQWGIFDIDHNGMEEELPVILLKLAIPGVLLKRPTINVMIPDVLLNGTYEASVEEIRVPVELKATTENNSEVVLSETVVGNRATGIITYIRRKLIKLLEEPS